MSLKITFAQEKDVLVSPASYKKVTELNVNNVIDRPSQKVVVANLREIGSVVLWQGAAYDAIGQWTDTDVINRLNQLYNS